MFKTMIAAASLLILSPNTLWACPQGTKAITTAVNGKKACEISGEYLNSQIHLNNNFVYVLNGEVQIGGDGKNSSTLSIDPGVRLYGRPDSYIIISRGSQIYAQGSAQQPIVFTALDQKNPVPGAWGGLVITGFAKVNDCKGDPAQCDNAIEGILDNPPKFGGNNDNDSSGVLSYVRVEYAGDTVATDNELNAITFYAVGRGTQVDHIQAYKGLDDGIEIFGGTVNIRYAASIDNGDDALDWDKGWTGNAQFVYIELVHPNSEDPNGIEADNLKSPMTAMPRSNPSLSNVTIYARPGNPKIFNGILLRRGTGTKIYNTLVTGGFQNCLAIDDDETFNNGGVATANGVTQTGLIMENSMIHCPQSNAFEISEKNLWSIGEWFSQSKLNNFVMDPMLIGHLPAEESPAIDTGITPPILSGDWQFIPVDYMGAFSPYEDEDWMLDWVIR